MNNIRRVRAYFFRAAPLLSVALLTPAWGTTSPFELDLKELDRHRPPIAEKQEKAHQPVRTLKPSPPRRDKEKRLDRSTSFVRYTVKEGDHVFKILMREFGLSNDEAEQLLPTVARLNDLPNVRKLSVGQVLLLPTGQPAPKALARKPKPTAVKEASSGRSETRRGPTAAPFASSPPPEPEKQEALPPAGEATAAANVAVEPEAPAAATPPAVVTGAPVAPDSPAVAAARADAPAPSLPTYPVKVLPIAGMDNEMIVDDLTKALSLSADKKRIVELKGAAVGNAFSIKVDRYIEEGGQRIIINCTDKDQFNYTLLRLLEQEGYRVIHAERGDFRSIAGSLLAHLNKVHEFTVRQVETKTQAGKKDTAGYLVGDGMNDLQLFLYLDQNDESAR